MRTRTHQRWSPLLQSIPLCLQPHSQSHTQLFVTCSTIKWGVGLGTRKAGRGTGNEATLLVDGHKTGRKYAVTWYRSCNYFACYLCNCSQLALETHVITYTNIYGGVLNQQPQHTKSFASTTTIHQLIAMATYCRVHALLCWSEQACRRIHDQLHPWSRISVAILFNPLTCMLNYSSQFMTVNTLSLRSQSMDEVCSQL